MTIGDETHTDRGTSLSRAEDAQPQNAPLIVIVEEQPTVRELLRWMLLLAGYRTRMYADREAILTPREQPLQQEDSPAVLLLDLSLHSPAEAQEYVRRVRVHWQLSYSVVPAIVILTTQPQVQEALLPREQVLLKPFHVHDLLTLIQQEAPVAAVAAVDICSSFPAAGTPGAPPAAWQRNTSHSASQESTSSIGTCSAVLE